MKNKKLIIINVLTFIAFIFVVGAGIYQVNAVKDKHGKEKQALENEKEEKVHEEAEKLLITSKEPDSAQAKTRKSVGSKTLWDMDFPVVKEVEEMDEEEEIIEEVEREENKDEVTEFIQDKANNSSSYSGETVNDNVVKSGTPKKNSQTKPKSKPKADPKKDRKSEGKTDTVKESKPKPDSKPKPEVPDPDPDPDPDPETKPDPDPANPDPENGINNNKK